MKRLSVQHFQEMLDINVYLERHSKNDPSFHPESLASEAINKVILEEGYSSDVENEIKRIITVVENSDHSNGSGWLDYKCHLEAILELNRRA